MSNHTGTSKVADLVAVLLLGCIQNSSLYLLVGWWWWAVAYVLSVWHYELTISFLSALPIFLSLSCSLCICLVCLLCRNSPSKTTGHIYRTSSRGDAGLLCSLNSTLELRGRFMHSLPVQLRNNVFVTSAQSSEVLHVESPQGHRCGLELKISELKLLSMQIKCRSFKRIEWGSISS